MISVDTVKAFSEKIIDHSKKHYGAENVVMGVIEKNSDEIWQGNWLLYWQEDEYKGTLQGLNQEHLLQPMMETLAMYLQENKYQAQLSDVPTVSKVHVKGVNGLTAFAEVVEYLRTVSSVEEVEVMDVFTDAIAMEVVHRGDSARLNRFLARDNVLVMMPDSEEFTDVLTYHWGQEWQDS